MPIDAKNQYIIKQSVLGLAPSTQVYLSGSRTDDAKKDGNIALIIISEKINLKEKLKILSQIFEKIEKQKIDLFIPQ